MTDDDRFIVRWGDAVDEEDGSKHYWIELDNGEVREIPYADYLKFSTYVAGGLN